MKIVSFTLFAATLASASAGRAPSASLRKKRATKAKIQQRLLEKATLFTGSRQLEQPDENAINYQDYPYLYEIKVQSCLALPAYSDDAAEIFQSSSEMASLASSGTIGAQKSFVLLDLCRIDTGFPNPFNGNSLKSSSSSSTCDGGTYIIDLATYMETISQVQENQEAQGEDQDYGSLYCQACWDSADYCPNAQQDANQNANQEQEDGLMIEGLDQDSYKYFDFSLLTGDSNDRNYVAQQDDANAEDQAFYGFAKITTSEGQLFGISSNNGGNNGGSTSVLVSCSVCESRCGWGEDAQQDAQEQDAQEEQEEMQFDEWAAQLAECTQTDAVFEGNDELRLYAGWMCNNDGSMIEPILFLEDTCTVFEFASSYANAVYGTEDATTLANSEYYIASMFNQSFPLGGGSSTPTPMSWATAIQNANQIVEWMSQFDELEQQYYEITQNGANADDQTLEQLWDQTMLENMQGNQGGDNQLSQLIEQGIDLATCDGSYGEYYYDSEENGQVAYTKSSVLQLNDGGDEDMTGACAIIYLMGGDYSSINLNTASVAYYNYQGSTSKTSSGRSGGKITHKEAAFHLSTEARIILISLSVVLGVFVLLTLARKIIRVRWIKKDSKAEPLNLDEKEPATTYTKMDTKAVLA